MSWIPSWDEGLCYDYNLWRTGLHQLTGYLLGAKEEGILEEGLKKYIELDITYMIGWQDTCNCNLGNTSYNTHICYYAPFNGNNGTCDDNILELTCAAMLQGLISSFRMILIIILFNGAYTVFTQYFHQGSIDMIA